MSIAMMLKIFSDCCICFAILASGPVEFQFPLLIPALLYGISAGIAVFFQEKGLTALRRLCAVLPLGCLMLAGNAQQGLILAIPAIYTALMILLGKLELEYYSYRKFFIQSLALVGGAYVIANIWIFLARATNDVIPDLEPAVILRYSLVHLFCGIVLQRQLRLGVGYKSEGSRRQISMLVAAAGAIIFGFLAAEPLLRGGITVLVKYLLTLIGIPFGLLFRLIPWLISLFEKEQTYTPEEDGTALVDINSIFTPMGEGIEQVLDDREKYTPDPTHAWIALVVILTAIAAVILFRSFHKRLAPGDPGEIGGRVITAPKVKRTSPLSNRSKVRQLYREFLRVENGHGLKLKPCDTSADVLRRIHPNTHRESADELRQLYLLARYDDRRSIRRSHVNRAKQALKGTRQGKHT